MALLNQIDSDLTEAMKAHDEAKTSTLRLLKSAIKNWQIAQQNEPDDNDISTIIQKEIKTRRDSIEMFKQGGREELAKKEEAEITILEKYLPEQMPEAEVRAKVQEAISKTGASSIQDMGKVMGVLMGELKGKADGSTISRLVKEELSK